ncbi:BnaC04g03570D [Brassica napus]|uniref:BnaC04g03570D protein n=1 Tax=Brassica napus TaxID=3708 RepID=A0A078FYG6_BRANA|nr:BnaC04g03570D [Brassica napus]
MMKRLQPRNFINRLATEHTCAVCLSKGNEVDLSSMHKQSIEYAEAKKSTMKMLRCRRNSGDWGRKAHSGRERVDGREG